MAYTAEITDKFIRDGRATVAITYTNGSHTFTDTMTSRSGQSGTWLTDEVARRLTELSGLDALYASVSLGAVTIPSPPNPEPQTPREIYADKLAKFNAALNAARQGIINEDAPAFATLRTWLRNNFLAEYLDMFV